MTLEQAISSYANTHVTPANDWYQWKKINHLSLPAGITLPPENQYHQNVSLKRQLCEQYHAGNDETKISLTKYYISTWGGVKRNSPDKIRNYSLNTPEFLIAQGKSGIPSWSKALSIRNPQQHSIYDARVALSLNAIQIVYKTERPSLYPLLAGQNKRINLASKRVSAHANENARSNVPDSKFYTEYNATLATIGNTLTVEPFTLEMLLFSHALLLFNAAFPEKQIH